MSRYKDEYWAKALPHVQTPGQYVGAEWNMVRKDPERVPLRFCLAFPDTYAIGMSHGGLQVLYGILNERDDTYAERAFTPWNDMRDCMVRNDLPLCSLETFTPLCDFDIVGFSLQYEMGFTNLLDMLELGRVPVLAADRSLDDPLIVAGGPCAFNPEPLADFVDLFVIGDGEETVQRLADACLTLKRDRPATREEMLCYLVTHVPGTYAPALYEMESSGRVTPRSDLPASPPARIRAARVADLDATYVPERPIVPSVETIHDRITIEIMRGCSRGCRFCTAGMTRRPVRYRSVETVVSLCEKQYAATGHSEIALASLSSSDHPDLPRMAREISMRFSDRKVSINLPSLRINEQLTAIPEMVSGVRKSTLTLAPEAATERLRRIINKQITDEDLLRGVEAAFKKGWTQVKLYFMTGLPGESDEDIAAIPRIADKVSNLRRQMGKGPARVNLSVATFVPKPHTPFEREPMVSLQRIEEIRSLLRSANRNRAVNLRFHHPERSFLEGVFARGDRRLGRVLLEARRLGCRLDAWDEMFDFAKWRTAFEKAGVSGDDYATRARSDEEILPWAHIDSGVSEDFLRREHEKAIQGVYTPDCRSGCLACGIPNCPNASPNDEGSSNEVSKESSQP